ncbi:MAG: DEAD/DEAH box helicase, partial [Planctomycetes bacterium]|nr:DEAD/DEAH box helicase [Planctomycetota bacterium]
MTPTARSLADLPGVGPARLAALVDAGITSPKDLLAWFPRRHRRLPAPISIADLKAESFATLDVCISRLTRRRGRRRGRSHLDLEVEDASGRLSVVLYNQGYLAQSWLPGAHLRLAGQLSADGENFQPVYHRRIDIDDRPGGAEILVEYPPISGIPAATLARLVEFTRVALAPALTDPLPSSLRCDRGLPDLAETLRILHQPKIDDPVGRAEARLLYHGFLATALRVESGRDERQPDPASVRAIITTDALQQRIEAGFGFELTPDQRAAVATIRADLAGNRPMRRLLQGDVGCGKTAVAVCAALSVAAAGAQVAILLPTDPLARQFAARLTLAAAPLGLGCELLVGGGRVADRRASRSRLAAGRSQLAIGTHAIFQDSVRFRDLGLVVVDEQHRFGVLQRLRLVRKGRSPHLLAMSATPIPRTLAMVAHSDLDQTEIRQRPPGHGRIQTRHHVVARDGRYDWAALAARLARGGRAFIVFPAVETEEGSMPSVLDEGRRIAAKYFRGLSVAALHGRMDEALKHKNLEAFREGVVRALFC